MIQFDYASDMHVDMNIPWEQSDHYDGTSRVYPWHLQKRSDILVLGGDCGNDPWLTMALVEEARSFYPTVIFTEGNHEHYIGGRIKESTVSRNRALLRTFSGSKPGVHYLNGSVVSMGDVWFIGSNGWYDFMSYPLASREQQHQFWKSDSNDARNIRFDPGGYPDKLAMAEAARLREIVLSAQNNDMVSAIVCVTHTIPHPRGSVGNHHPWSYLNGAYVNGFMEQVWLADRENKIKVWTYGHTHWLADFDAEGIRFVNNARGYHGERRRHQFEGLTQITIP